MRKSILAMLVFLVTSRRDMGSRALPFLLISDQDGAVRKMLGILPSRVTYVIDGADGVWHLFSAVFSGQRHLAEALRGVRALMGNNEQSDKAKEP